MVIMNLSAYDMEADYGCHDNTRYNQPQAYLAYMQL